MKIQTQSVNFKADSDLLKFVDDKTSSLSKFYDKIISVEVYLSVQKTSEKENKHTEIKVNVPGKELVVKKITKSFEEGVSKSTDSLERLLKKIKEKQRESSAT